MLGVSTDNEFVHVAWRKNHPDLKDLPFPMLADIKHELSTRSASCTRPRGSRCAPRSSSIPKGIIRFVSVTDLDVGRNVDEVVRVLDALQTDELCPCNWQKGEADPAGRLTMSALDELRDAIPEAARDLKLNLQSVLAESSLSPAQRWGTAVAAAVASRNPLLRNAVLTEARAATEAAVVDDAIAAAALMGMNNVYYRFRHLIGREVYSEKPARLRMNRIAKPAASKLDFELFCLAVSAINGCESCLKAQKRWSSRAASRRTRCTTPSGSRRSSTAPRWRSTSFRPAPRRPRTEAPRSWGCHPRVGRVFFSSHE